MKSRLTAIAVLAAAIVAAVWVGRAGSESLAPGAQRQQHGLASAQPSLSEPESLQAAFVRIGQEVGPAVVGISTEQIERVKQYFRVHPFFGGPGGQGGSDPFEEFFRQFYGDQGEGGPDGGEREFHRFGLGSGVIIDAKGLVLTNEHVVANADKITVTMADGREFTGEVKGKDPRTDLAVIKIDAKKLPVATLGDSETVKTGQWAVAIGNPFGLMGSGPSVRATGAEPTLTVGVVSALNRQLPRITRADRDYSGLIQTDAAINPGNSGGPLLNLEGQVIGINVAILTSSRGYEGIGFAIPVNKAKHILEALVEGRKIVYGWLGVQIQDITEDVAEYYGLSEPDGVLVYQVLPDSPAEKAGMKDGDIIKAFGGEPVSHTRQLIDKVSATPTGKKAPLEVLREGKPVALSIEIGERPTEPALAEADESSEAWRGVKVAELSPEAAQQFNLPAETKGVVVIDVAADSPAEEAGLRSGDLINEINRQKIESLRDYRAATEQVKGNALVRTNRGYVVIKGE